MRVLINNETDITNLIMNMTWSGDTKTAARKLDFSFVQDDRDENIPVVNLDAGYTIFFYDDDNNLAFQGNIYNLEKDRKNSSVKVTAFDNLYVLNKSKTTRKFSGALPEDIARGVCSEMGIKAGNIAATNTPVSFIANSKTGYQIIQGAYYEAHKINNKIYQQIMNGDSLDIVEKGTDCGVVLDSAANMTDSIYKKSIEDIVNAVMITDTEGNPTGNVISDNDSISRYSMFLEVYKAQKDKDTQTEARAMLKKPELEGVIVALGDFRLKAGYSLIVRDSNFNGRFYIKSDSHTFNDLHTCRLILEFELLMTEEKVEKAK